MSTAWLNDVPVEDLGLIPAAMDNWWAPAATALPALTVPGLWGSRLSDRGASAEPRRVSFVSTLESASLGARLANLDALSAALRGVIEVRLADDPERVAYGFATTQTVGFFAPQLTEPDVRVTVDILIPSAAKWDRRSRVVIATGTTGALVPTGTLPHRGRLWISDTLSNRTIEIVRADGTVIGMLRLTGVLATGEYLEIDMERDTPSVTKVSSAGALRVDVYSTWLNPADVLPIFDPDDVPRVRHTGGGSVVCLYRRGWAT